MSPQIITGQDQFITSDIESTDPNENIRHFRISKFDNSSDDQSAWITANLIAGNTLYVRTIDLTRQYSYEIVAVSQLIQDSTGSIDEFYDIFVDGGLEISGPSLIGQVELDIDPGFSDPRSWQYTTSGPFGYPIAREFVSDDPSQNDGGQAYYIVIHKESFFGNDQSELLDSLTAAADPLNPTFLYFKGGNLRYDSFRIDAAYYYSTEEYYVFVGQSLNVVGTGDFPIDSLLVNVFGLQYVPPTGSGVNGSFVAQSGETITVTNGIITSIA